MSFAEIIFLLLSKKKALFKFVLFSFVTSGVYLGAVRPSISSSVTKLEGTNILQGKFRDSIKLAKARISDVHNALDLTSLENVEEQKYKFHPSLSKYLNKKNISEKQNWKKFDFGKIKQARDNANFCDACASLSDKDIVYGESYFSKIVSGLEESELVQDILWSLWEESRYSGTLIHAETIKVDLRIDRTQTISEVKQFSLSFKVSNFRDKKTQVFRTIELDPHTEVEINILLSNSDLRPVPVAVGIQGLKYTSWNLFPKNAQWKVIKNIQKPKRQTVIENYDFLQLIYGSSRFIPYTISKEDQGIKVAVNSIDYPYIKSKLNPYLNSITAERVKEDIENWYGGYFAYLLRSRIEDIQNIIELMQKKTILNKKGIKESIFEQTLNNYQFRNNLYYHFKIKGKYREIFNNLLTNNGSNNEKVRIKIEEVIGLLKSWVAQFKDIQDSIKVQIKWNQSPKKVYSHLGQNSQFPTFAFNFEQKITWVKDMIIPLKGTWDVNRSKYEQTKQVGDGKYNFDISNKLVNIKDILIPLTDTFAAWNNNLGGINIMNDLIPDVGSFIGLDSLNISRGESITYTYKTTGSPITLMLDNNGDLQEKHFPSMNIGWKALDVSSALNLSNFTKFFYSLYEKFDLGVKDKETLGVVGILQAKKELMTRPISFVAHAINSIFDESYGIGKEAKRQEDVKKRPWPVFFQSLFSDPLTFAHSQMMVGYSKLFFKYDDWWGKENKTNISKGCESESEEVWCTNFDFSKKTAIATPINDEVNLIAKSLIFNHSMYMPDAPIVLDSFSSSEQYNNFLEKNGRGKTSWGVLNSEKEIIEAVRRDYVENVSSFEAKKVMNWDKAKVSFAQLNLKKAIDSVLVLPNTWSGWDLRGVTLSLSGIQFHNILGEALMRDGFWVNVNLMHEYGMFTKYDARITKTMSYFPNSEIWLKVIPSLDYEKLNIGRLKELLS